MALGISPRPERDPYDIIRFLRDVDKFSQFLFHHDQESTGIALRIFMSHGPGKMPAAITRVIRDKCRTLHSLE